MDIDAEGLKIEPKGPGDSGETVVSPLLILSPSKISPILGGTFLFWKWEEMIQQVKRSMKDSSEKEEFLGCIVSWKWKEKRGL